MVCGIHLLVLCFNFKCAKMLKQIFHILLFYFLGEFLSGLIGGFVPGSVIGMILLFTALHLRWVKPCAVEEVSLKLTKRMELFFLPAGVGLMTAAGVILENWFFLLIASVLSSVLILAIVGWMQQMMGKESEDE